MFLYALDFEYANKRLSDFGCMICQISNNESGIEEVELGCDITFDTVRNSHSSIQKVISATYENVFTTTFEVMKSNCNNSTADHYFNGMELEQLVTWLSRTEYHKFKPLSLDGESDIHYYGSFNIKKININNRTIGLSLTFTSNAPYGFGEKVVHEIRRTNYEDNDNFHIFIHGNATIYPIVKITCRTDMPDDIYYDNDGAYYEIWNRSEPYDTNNGVGCDGFTRGETLLVDCENKVIHSDKRSNSLLANQFYYDFLYLTPGDNTLEPLSGCYDITIEYEPIRKVGVF